MFNMFVVMVILALYKSYC